MYTTYQVAHMTGVTLRALRYYDKIGLVRPSHYTDSGYRQYSEGDLSTLQQVLLYKELDFSLATIRDIMGAPDFDRSAALTAQAELLARRAQRYSVLAQLAQNTWQAMKGEKTMQDKDMFAGFDYDKMMEEQQTYQAEVQQRWGDCEAYRESRKRTAHYTKKDWMRISQDQGDTMQVLAECFQRNVPVDDDDVQAAVHVTRQFITDHFYECTLEIWGGLGEMYVADDRFRATYDKIAPGLAVYFRNAIRVYMENRVE